MADLPKPCMWTLSETVAARQTTSRGFLWFSDPQNSGWEPLFTADQLDAHAAAKVAEERSRIAELLRRKHEEVNGAHNYFLVAARMVEGGE